MKFLFIAVLNHEDSVSRLSQAFVLIADALPRAKLKLELYGTDAMMEAVAQLYAQIMRFSQRAIIWYTEGKLKHMYHSITQVLNPSLLSFDLDILKRVKPYSLSYKDIIDDVQACSVRIEQLAADQAQLETRVIYNTQLDIQKTIKSIEKSITGNIRGHVANDYHAD